MIAYLKGTVHSISGQEVVVNVLDVGYLLTCTASCLANLKLGQKTEVIVYTDVQETSIRLFGFADQLEKQVFQLLIAVSGIGAKIAVDILSHLDKVELLRTINQEDLDGLKKIKGVGAKTAARLVVELRDKVSELVESSKLSSVKTTNDPHLEEASQAMAALGFSTKDIQTVLQAIKPDISSKTTTSEIVRMALSRV